MVYSLEVPNKHNFKNFIRRIGNGNY
ncbi:hypothetical protein [Nostoc sp. CMAA1605]